MAISENEMKARRTISNGRLIVIVAAVTLIGSFIKLLYFGFPDEVNSGMDATLVHANLFNTILSFFPTLGLNDLSSPDNIVILCMFAGLVYGISMLKKGYADLKKVR